MNQHFTPFPAYALYLMLAIAAWIVWQVFTGSLIYKSIRCRRKDDPKAFWIGITIQALPTLGCLCIAVKSSLGVWIIGVLYFGLFLASLIALSWFIGRDIRHQIVDPRDNWAWRKYPRVYWLFATHQTRLAALELEALLLERPGDKETIRMLDVAYERTGKRDTAREQKYTGNVENADETSIVKSRQVY